MWTKASTKTLSGLALIGVLILAPPAWFLDHVVDAQPASTQRVSRETLVRAMSLQRGFDIKATTNGSRFQGGVLLQLARWALEQNPDGPPLFIDYEDSFEAYLQVAQLTRAQAPLFVRHAYDHRQTQVVEYRKQAVIAAVDAGPQPTMTLSVTASWPAMRGMPESFSYVDTYSDPNLKVTNQRMVTYKLIDFGDFTLYDRINGVSGRPISGALGFIFRVLGDSQVVQSRAAITTTDQLQIVKAHARWHFIDRNPLVTIQVDGKAREGIDRTRQDLRDIEKRLNQEIRIRYRQE
jgi:hypothetical protein